MCRLGGWVERCVHQCGLAAGKSFLLDLTCLKPVTVPPETQRHMEQGIWYNVNNTLVYHLILINYDVMFSLFLSRFPSLFLLTRSAISTPTFAFCCHVLVKLR